MNNTKLAIILGSVISLWLILGLIPIGLFTEWDERGTFGDMFGAVNALFSGLALAGVILAIVMQSKELSLQREELELTRKELKRSASAHEESASELSNQVNTMRHSATLMAYSQLIGDCDRRIREITSEHGLSIIARTHETNEIRTERDKYIAGTRQLLDQLNPERENTNE